MTERRDNGRNIYKNIRRVKKRFHKLKIVIIKEVFKVPELVC